ncbi:MAG: chorismate synthase [Deltaproteobacteria bacterium]|jgi:chorismate synthase|nr:chorismate synthase [Deltaproteobacteria bacterium]
MGGSVFGKNFKIATFGESHGPALGVVIDGIPAGLAISESLIQADLDRRRPGNSPFTSPRREADIGQILSGLTDDGLTNGAPMAIVIQNRAFKKSDYKNISQLFRPGHADWTYFKKYGLSPQSGGGRASGRETAARVAAGAVARVILSPLYISIRSGTEMVGPLKAEICDFDFSQTDPLRFLDPHLAPKAQELVLDAMKRGDSVGSVVMVEALGVPVGLGEPVFDKLSALLGHAYFSIGAVRAVEFGEGIEISKKCGSESNDPMGPDGPLGDHHGGFLGGVSTGRPIRARLFIKPTPSISLPQKTIDLNGEPQEICVHGRHDPCLAPRLAVVAEAMTLIVLADLYLSSKLSF